MSKFYHLLKNKEPNYSYKRKYLKNTQLVTDDEGKFRLTLPKSFYLDMVNKNSLKISNKKLRLISQGDSHNSNPKFKNIYKSLASLAKGEKSDTHSNHQKSNYINAITEYLNTTISRINTNTQEDNSFENNKEKRENNIVETQYSCIFTPNPDANIVSMKNLYDMVEENSLLNKKVEEIKKRNSVKFMKINKETIDDQNSLKRLVPEFFNSPIKKRKSSVVNMSDKDSQLMTKENEFGDDDSSDENMNTSKTSINLHKMSKNKNIYSNLFQTEPNKPTNLSKSKQKSSIEEADTDIERIKNLIRNKKIIDQMKTTTESTNEMMYAGEYRYKHPKQDAGIQNTRNENTRKSFEGVETRKKQSFSNPILYTEKRTSNSNMNQLPGVKAAKKYEISSRAKHLNLDKQNIFIYNKEKWNMIKEDLVRIKGFI